MKNIYLISALIFIVFFSIAILLGLSRLTPRNINPDTNVINSFQECVDAGNPIMESYPRKCGANGKTFTEEISAVSTLTESEARVIAEEMCVKGGETLEAGSYNINSKTWWFDANLNSTKEGCNPACVVAEETKLAEINWRCTGLIAPVGDDRAELQKIFQEKYPQYAESLIVSITIGTSEHARGSITFEPEAPGGIFLATKTEGKWQIVHDGNGQIPCSLSEYGFPSDMLFDCAE